MKQHTTAKDSTRELTRRRFERRNALIVMGVLAVALIMPSFSHKGGWIAENIVWAGLYLTGVGLLLGGAVKNYLLSDEFQRTIQLKAAALTLLAVMGALLALGMVYAVTTVAIVPLVQGITLGGLGLWSVLVGIVTRRSEREE